MSREAFEIESPESVIVTLEPSVAAREALAVAGGVPAEDLHLTVLRLGAPPETLDMGLLATIMDAEVVKWPPMSGSVSGIGFFGPEGFEANTVALVDVDWLAKFRTYLQKAFDAAGVPVDEGYNFMPHITLAEGPVEDAGSRVGVPVEFGELAIRSQGQVASWSLVGPAKDEPSMTAPVEEAGSVMYEIREDSEPCAAETEGAMTVAVVEVMEDGSEVVESCHESVERAQTRVDELMAAESAEVEEMPEMEMPEGVVEVEASATAAGLAELERAAALADRVRDVLGLLSTFGRSEFTETASAVLPGFEEFAADPVVETLEEGEAKAEASAEFVAIRSHETATNDDPWDGPGNEVNVISPNDESYFADVFAWRDDEADTTVKANYRFIHHFVSEDGSPGAASTVACSTGIGVLNGGRGGTTIPTGDRQGVYDHLARHLLDADRTPPELLSVEAYEAALASSNEALAAELATPVEDGGFAGLSDDDLIAELARRWATEVVERLSAPVESVETEGAEMAEVEIEIEVPSEDEGEGSGEMCPMCEGAGMVAVNGLEAACPMCEGTGYVEAAPEEEMPMMLEVPGPGSGMDAAAAGGDYDWEGVLIVEGIPSGDGRMIGEGALTWRELPIPLMLQTVNAPGHDGAVISGSIHEIVREGQNIVGRGRFDSGDAGSEARRLLSEGTMRGVSADIDSVVVEFVTPDGQDVSMEDMMFAGVDALEVLVEGRIMGATLTPFPAFQEAHVRVIDLDGDGDADVALVAAGAIGDVWRVPSPLGAWLPGEGDAAESLASLVASAAAAVEVPVNPPREWFEPGSMEKPEPFTVHADGRVYGLVAQWGTCHIGFTDRCVNVPKTGSAYKHFRNKNVLTAEGDLVATGPIFMDTVHPDLRLRASDTQAFYADTGCAVADVALYENEFGIVAAGSLRPGMTPEQVRRFRGSDVSPDWRQIGGRLEVVGLLSVNVSGFIVEGLVASGAEVSNPRGVWDSTAGELTSLVAAGMVRHEQSDIEALRAEVEALRVEMADFREAVRPIRAERAAERFARLAAAFGDKQAAVDSHGCGGVCGGSDEACACGS